MTAHANTLFNPASPVPDFASFTAADFLPALDIALAEVEKKVRAIKADTRAPDFQNTVVPLESLFAETSRLGALLSNLSLNAYSDEIAKVEEAFNLKCAAASNAVFQDPVLGQRFRAVYATATPADADDKAILKSLYRRFETSGALLDAAGQARVSEIEATLISLCTRFNDNLNKAPKQQAVLVTDPAELAGLSVDDIEKLRQQAEEEGHAEGWLFIPERLLVDEWLETAEHPGFRRKMLESLNRIGTEAPYDNRPIIDEMQKLRAEYAALLGYDSYAACARVTAMHDDLDAVYKMISDTVAKCLPKFEADMRALETFAAINGGPPRLEPADVPFWAAKQRKAVYAFDAADFAKYLPLENVLESLFAEAGHLFGVTFKEVKGHSTIHPDIAVYEVTNIKTGAREGYLHMDHFARPGEKGGGAWMNVLQPKGEGRENIIICNMNLSKPSAGRPCLVPLGQYVTFFHEMGHCLHGLLGTNVKYASQEGTNCPTDYVEFHSTVNEARALLRQNLEKFAVNPEDGSRPPANVLDSLLASEKHFKVHGMLRLLQNSLRDLAFHATSPADYKGTEAVEESVKIDSPYADHIRPYPLTRFSHLFSDPLGGYAAGYVNYALAEILATDGFVPFQNDPYNKEQAAKLEALYRRGAGGDHAEIYRSFRGRDATPEALLVDLGVVAAKKPASPGAKPG